MAVVGFVTLYSGVISGYFAAASTGALLTFILPVTITGAELRHSRTASRAGPSRQGQGSPRSCCSGRLDDVPTRSATRPAHCAPWPTSWTRIARRSPSGHVWPAERSLPSAGASSARSTDPPAPPDPWPRSRRFPTSLTGCSPSWRRRASGPCSISPAQRTRRRWRPAPTCSASARSGSMVVTDAPTLRGSTPRETPSPRRWCAGCPRSRPTHPRRRPRRARVAVPDPGGHVLRASGRGLCVACDRE